MRKIYLRKHMTNEIEGELREKIREHPEINNYETLKKFLIEHYRPTQRIIFSNLC